MKTGPRCRACLGQYRLVEAGAKSECAHCGCDYVESRIWEEVPPGTLWITDGEVFEK